MGGPDHGAAIAMSSDQGSIIRHNTLLPGKCAYNWKCGIILIGHKSDDDASVGTVVQDNILAELTSTDATGTTIDHNLFTGAQAPIFVGPAGTYAGYRLASGSPGKGAASDGKDVGIR